MSHDTIYLAFAENIDMVFVEYLLAIGAWRLALHVLHIRCLYRNNHLIGLNGSRVYFTSTSCNPQPVMVAI